jgi:cation-transporting ATPase 13A1
MYWGILMVTGVAFSASTEFVPELNEKLRLVPFDMDFKTRLTVTMVLDFVGCWAIEKTLKYMYSDYRPKDIAIRRPDQIEKEEKRKEAERLEEEEKKEAAAEAAAVARKQW